MTAIKSQAADGFIQRLPADIRFFLVHGDDEGLAHERSQAIVRKLIGPDPDPLRLVRLDGDALARRPEALADEAHAVSMFGGSRAIWIDAQGRDLTPALEPLMARPPEDCAIVIKAPLLKRGHALRTAFEKAGNAASIECWADDSNALAALVDGALRQAGLAIEPEARAALMDHLGADRQTSRAEISKLVTYAHGRSRIGIEDVRAIVSDAAPSPLDDVVDAALLGELAKAAAEAARFFAEGGSAEDLARVLVQRLTTLHRLRLEMEAGRDFDAACQAIYLRTSPEGRRALAKAAQRWTSEAIAQRLPSLRTMSANVRGTPHLADAIATRAIWSLASVRRR